MNQSKELSKKSASLFDSFYWTHERVGETPVHKRCLGFKPTPKSFFPRTGHMKIQSNFKIVNFEGHTLRVNTFLEKS